MAIPKTNRGTSSQRTHIKFHWTPQEDNHLIQLVSAYGPAKWERIASYIDGRSGKSCRTRWLNQLDPRLNKAPFTDEENKRLLKLHRIYGNKWSFISRFFHFRTDNHVKNQYYVLSRRPVGGFDPQSPFLGGFTQLSGMGPTFAYGPNQIGSPILRRLGIAPSQCPVPQSQNELEFFDFLGVGNSE